MAVFAGTMLGVGAAFVAEMFGQRVRTSEALETATGLPVLVQFTQNLELIGIKRWWMKFVGAVLLKFRFSKAAATV